jgi:hypothetical protein
MQNTSKVSMRPVRAHSKKPGLATRMAAATSPTAGEASWAPNRCVTVAVPAAATAAGIRRVVSSRRRRAPSAVNQW